MHKEPFTPSSITGASIRVGNERKKIFILHVEDDEVDATLTRKAILKQMAQAMPEHIFCIDLVTSLREALKVVATRHYDMVLLDLALADIEGLDNLRALKSQRPSLPIVVLTGTSDSNLAVAAVADGADDYVEKMQMGDPAFQNAILRALKARK